MILHNSPNPRPTPEDGSWGQEICTFFEDLQRSTVYCTPQRSNRTSCCRSFEGKGREKQFLHAMRPLLLLQRTAVHGVPLCIIHFTSTAWADSNLSRPSSHAVFPWLAVDIRKYIAKVSAIGNLAPQTVQENDEKRKKKQALRGDLPVAEFQLLLSCYSPSRRPENKRGSECVWCLVWTFFFYFLEMISF